MYKMNIMISNLLSCLFLAFVIDGEKDGLSIEAVKVYGKDDLIIEAGPAGFSCRTEPGVSVEEACAKLCKRSAKKGCEQRCLNVCYDGEQLAKNSMRKGGGKGGSYRSDKKARKSAGFILNYPPVIFYTFLFICVLALV